MNQSVKICSHFLLGILLTIGFLVAQETSSRQAAVGAVTIDGKIWNQIALRPVIPIWKFGVALDLVFYIDENGNLHKDEWDFSGPTAIKNTIIDKIYYIRFGHRNDPLYFKVGALDYVELGYGILVDGYSNSIQYPQVRKIGLDLSAKIKKYSIQGFVNDFKENMGVIGVRVQSPVMVGIPVGISMVLDRNQFLGLKDSDGDGRPDLVDDFPKDKSYWLNTDGDQWADNDTLNEFDIDGDGLTDPGYTIPHFGIIIDSNVVTKPEPINIKKNTDQVGAVAIDAAFPIVVEQNMSVSIYAQLAQMLGETKDPKTGSKESLGMGIVPFGLSARFGPARFNLEYRMIPKGRFEFGYWNQSYEIERTTSVTEFSEIGENNLVGLTNIITKESRLGRFGKQKGFYARFSVNVGSLLVFTTSYQRLQGEMWNAKLINFSEEANQSLSAVLQLQRSISKIKTAQMFYQQRNVPNPFKFEFTESTIIGYRAGLEISSGIILSYTFQRSFRDVNGDGDVNDPDEIVNITTVETSFTF